MRKPDPSVPILGKLLPPAASTCAARSVRRACPADRGRAPWGGKTKRAHTTRSARRSVPSASAQAQPPAGSGRSASTLAPYSTRTRCRPAAASSASRTSWLLLLAGNHLRVSGSSASGRPRSCSSLAG